MSNLAVIERYVKALFDVANEKKLTSSILEDLMRISVVFAENENLRYFFDSKSVPYKDKLELLLKIAESQEINDISRNYFLLSLENKRFHYELPHLSYVTFKNMYKKEKGIRQGVLYISRILSDKKQQELTEMLSQKLGVRLELEFRHEPDLIDGSRLEVDGMVYEDNLKMRLANLENWMKV